MDECKNQESILSSTTSDSGHNMGKWQKYNKTSHKREPRCQPFPSWWPQGCNKQARQHDRHKTQIRKMIHKRSTALERSLKYFIYWSTSTSFMVPTLPLFLMGSRKIDVWFAWKIPNLSMYHLLVNANRDAKRGETKIRSHPRSKRSTTVKPRWARPSDLNLALQFVWFIFIQRSILFNQYTFCSWCFLTKSRLRNGINVSCLWQV